MQAANDTNAGPASPSEAEALAVRLVGDYLTACRITERGQIGDRLMKLCSIAGIGIAQAEGAASAHDRLAGTARFVLKHGLAEPLRVELTH
jgi:hypothetical protein